MEIYQPTVRYGNGAANRGRLVIVYYFTSDDNPEQHIAASIWADW